MIDLGGGRYLLMGHLRQDSITVDVGQQVTEGEPIARVGNSGHTSHPHLHIQAQTLPTGISDITTVDGPRLVATLHTYPLLFRGASSSAAASRPGRRPPIPPRRLHPFRGRPLVAPFGSSEAVGPWLALRRPAQPPRRGLRS